MTNGYPLARLAEIRASRATGAVIDLAAALAGEVEAEAAVVTARATVEEARTAARQVALAGEVGEPAWQVSRRAAWAERLRREVTRAEAGLAARVAEVAEWQAAVALAREQATAARAEHRVVERHRERWTEEERKKRERREE